MEKNFHDFSMQEAMKLANSDAGRQLIALLRQQNSQQLNTAMDQAAAGDMTGVKDTINKMLANPQAKELLQQLGRSTHE